MDMHFDGHTQETHAHTHFVRSHVRTNIVHLDLKFFSISGSVLVSQTIVSAAPSKHLCGQRGRWGLSRLSYQSLQVKTSSGDTS